MSVPIITPDEISLFIMDRPEFNTLVIGVRWNMQLIEQAMDKCVDYYNLAPPSTGDSATLESFPNKYLLLIGTAGHLLRGAAINQASNEFSYSAEGMEVQDHDKSQIFSKLGNDFWAEFKQMVTDKKMQRNVARCYGVVGSEWRNRAFYS